jgi:hypothetical protein
MFFNPTEPGIASDGQSEWELSRSTQPRRLAERALEQLIARAGVNSLDYQARPTAISLNLQRSGSSTSYRSTNHQPNPPMAHESSDT